MNVRKEIQKYWIEFAEQYFESLQLDLFVSGYSLYTPQWFSNEPNTLVTLLFVGSIDDLKSNLNCNAWESRISSDNRLILSASMGKMLLEFQVFDSVDLLFGFIENRAINYERVCYSFRQNRFVDGVFVDKPTQMICDRPMPFESKRDLLQLCLKKKLRLELLVSSKYLGTINFAELCQLGLFEWIENHIYVSFLLDDLYHMGVLTQESKSFVLSLTSVLSWIEQNYSRTISFFEGILNELGQDCQKRLSFPYKKFLIYTSQTKFIESFEDEELEFLNEVSISFEQWIRYLEGDELSYSFLGEWIEKFQSTYLEAFLLSSMHLIRIYGNSKMCTFQITKIVQEFIVEERFVTNLLAKVDVEVSQDRFTELLVLRFQGQLKSRSALKKIVNV